MSPTSVPPAGDATPRQPAVAGPVPHGPGAISRNRASRLLDARAEMLARQGRAMAGPSAERRRYLVCEAGPDLYGIPVEAAGSVIQARTVMVPPGRVGAMLGLFGRGGELFSVVDLAMLLGRPAPAAGDPGHFVVLRRATPRVALRVDRALDVAPLIPLTDGADRAAGDDPVAGFGRRTGTDETSIALIDLDRLLTRLSPTAAILGA